MIKALQVNFPAPTSKIKIMLSIMLRGSVLDAYF